MPGEGVVYTETMCPPTDGAISDPASAEQVQEVASALRIELDWLRRQPGERATLQVTLSEAWMASLLKDVDARAHADGRLEGSIQIQGDGTVLLQGALAANFQVDCARCLSDAPVDASDSLCLTFIPVEHMRARLAGTDEEDSEGLELGAGDLDQFVYEGRELDLQSALREQILLAYPMRALCDRGEDCKGLCSACGASLNGASEDASRCPACGAPLDGGSIEDDGDAEVPAWKRTLAALHSEGDS